MFMFTAYDGLISKLCFPFVVAFCFLAFDPVVFFVLCPGLLILACLWPICYPFPQSLPGSCPDLLSFPWNIHTVVFNVHLQKHTTFMIGG